MPAARRTAKGWHHADPRADVRGSRRRAVHAALSGAALTLAMAVSSCAMLPDIAREMARPHPAQVAFADSAGPLPVADATRVMARLEAGGDQTDVLSRHLAYEQAVNAGSPLVLGNRLTLLQNGPDTYAAMFAAIAHATDSINLETYIFDDDASGQRFAELLLERQAAGVQVNIIYDSFGGVLTPPDFFARLAAGGIHVLEFNPMNPLNGNTGVWLPNNRDHRRQLVIDGRMAFTGGINISDTYSSSPAGLRARRHAAHATDAGAGWRDTHVQIEGPVVAEFQKLFMETWARQRGASLAARDYFPALPPAGEEIVRAIGSTPEDPQSLIWLTLMSAISHARYSVHLTIAYFAPDTQLVDALVAAAQRGVEVSLILPSYSDSWAIFAVGRSHYTRLLENGVKIHQRRGALMHAKTACIDGVWSTVGSTNLDWRSFLHNDEINAVVIGRAFATQMEAMFEQDLRESETMDLVTWRRRSLFERCKEQLALIGAYWL